jgi:hypothetical protein
MKMVIDIDRHGALYFLLNALIGAYNRRTDVMHAQIDPEALKQLTKKLKTSESALDQAVKANQPQGEE